MSKFHALKSLTQPKAYVISAQIRLSYSPQKNGKSIASDSYIANKKYFDVMHIQFSILF